jgi:hypothetical protein
MPTWPRSLPRGLEPDERETYSNGVLSVEPLWFPWMRVWSAWIPVEIGGKYSP